MTLAPCKVVVILDSEKDLQPAVMGDVTMDDLMIGCRIPS